MIHTRKTLAAVLFFAFAASGFHPVAGQEGQKLSINGTQIYYEVRGDGPPLLLLHYFGGCGQVWQPHVERLAKNYRLIIPDMRGHGRSTNPSGQFTHRQSARDMFALLDQLGIQRSSPCCPKPSRSCRILRLPFSCKPLSKSAATAMTFT